MADKHNDGSETTDYDQFNKDINQPAVSKPGSLFRASILTQKAEAIRTDKASFTNTDKPKFSISNNIFKSKIGDNNETKVASVSGDFVFGQSIMSRTSCVSDFATLAENDSSKKSDKNETVENAEANDHTESLRKNAEEVQKQNTIPLQIEETEVVTGEENETNVLRMTCKLYQFNSEKKDWIGKGPCIIRLNDCKTDKNAPARLLVRSKGGLKVIVNTFVWPGMSIEKAAAKSIRFNSSMSVENGTGSGKMFLVVLANTADADLFFELLSERKAKLKDKSTDEVSRKRHVNDDSADDSDVKVARKDESSE